MAVHYGLKSSWPAGPETYGPGLAGVADRFLPHGPPLLVGFLSGPLTDRFGSRKIILFSQVVNLVVSLLITLIILADRLAVWHLAVASPELKSQGELPQNQSHRNFTDAGIFDGDEAQWIGLC